MEIFNIEDDNPIITPEGLYIPELKHIWERDTSKTKEVASAQLVSIYHLVDPRSSYAGLDADTKRELVFTDYLEDPNYELDEAMLEAMEKYAILIKGPFTRYYESLQAALDSITAYMSTATVRGGKDGNFGQVQSNIANSDKLISAMAKAKDASIKETQATVTRLKGSNTFGLLSKEDI